MTAEYGMLPRATHTRSPREAAKGKQSGRTQEIQRLIGRSLRAITNLAALGERTVTLDCDVLQADGGTRTAAITGSYVALADACDGLLAKRLISAAPLHGQVAAISVGICGGVPVLDWTTPRTPAPRPDMNVVMNNGGGFIEVQGTAEGHAFRRHELDALLNLAAGGIASLFQLQSEGAYARLRRSPHSRDGQPARSAREWQSGQAARIQRIARGEWIDAGEAIRFRGSHRLLKPAIPFSKTHFKARNAALATGLPAIADDSGIEVDALGGAPGVHSARFAGENANDEANLAKLLAALNELPMEARTARYRCVIVFVHSDRDPHPLVGEGVWEGHVIATRRGQGGFGYDPSFVPAGETRTVAEMQADDKNRHSHRGQAMRAFLTQFANRS